MQISKKYKTKYESCSRESKSNIICMLCSATIKGGSSFLEMRNTGTNTKLLNEMPHLVFQHRIKGLAGPNWLSKLILIILPNNKEHSLVLLGTRKKSMA